MIGNYIRIAIRNLWRNKLFSAINIGGLAIGMTVSFTLLLYVIFQFSFDKFHAHVNDIYQVITAAEGGTSTPVPLASALPRHAPEVKAAARATYIIPHLLQAGDNALKQQGCFVDPQFLDIFSFPVIQGSAAALKDKDAIILTASAAKKIFKDQNPLGQLIKLDAKDPLVVRAVISDPPANSTVQFDFLCSWAYLYASEDWIRENAWGNFGILTYVQLYPGASMAAAEKKIAGILQSDGGLKNNSTLMLHPMKDWKLYNKVRNGKIIGGRIEIIRLLIWLALGILLIACVNFMNLSTAQAGQRAREVGVRKTIGATRGSLVLQFFGESLILVFISMILALFMMWLLLPAFNTFAASSIQLSKAPLFFWIAMIALLLGTGIIAGGYPAIFLSSFRPIKVLKGNARISGGGFRPRQVLVVLQFGLAVVLMIVTIVIYRQLNYIQNRPIGYDPKGLVDIILEGKLYDNYEVFRNAAIASGAATDGAIISSSIAASGGSTWGLQWPGQQAGEEQKSFGIIAATSHFAGTFDIPVVAGRDFQTPADSMNIMLNEAAVKEMHLKDPIGQEIIVNGQKRVITGVVKDFVWLKSYQPSSPMIFPYNPSWRGEITLRLNPVLSVTESMNRLQKVYHELNPDYPFDYTFVDVMYQQKYDYERFLGKLINIFASLAIIISCLGLLGLSIFEAAQRKKEIGIRKVMGAGIHQVTLLLSKDFLKPVLIAIVLASPIAAYIMSKWLENYTYRISLEWWMFAGAGLLAVFIALVTVSVQSIRAATMNPVKALRTE